MKLAESRCSPSPMHRLCFDESERRSTQSDGPLLRTGYTIGSNPSESARSKSSTFLPAEAPARRCQRRKGFKVRADQKLMPLNSAKDRGVKLDQGRKRGCREA